MAANSTFFNMPMYFEGKKSISVQPSVDSLQRATKNLTLSTSASSRDSVSSKSTGSSHSSRSSGMLPSNSDYTKRGVSSPLVDFRDTANTVNFTPISTQDVMIFTYGYRGYSDPLSVPGGFETICWDTEKIEETVTSQFLKERIPSLQGKERLDVPLGFGDGLTDETYAEWVVQKAKRFFLLLLEFGMPEKIFDVVDQSWDDDDLPLEPKNIHRLKLRENHDKILEQKFYKRQFFYLLKELSYKSHVDFEDEDDVPLVVSYRQKILGFSFPTDDRVIHPRHKDLPMYRRKVILGSEHNSLTDHDFLAEVDVLRNLRHPHITDLQASYTYLNEGCVLSAPACDYTLKSFIQNPSSTFKSLSKEQRRRRILGWMHCLADALAYLHDQGVKKIDIRPRTILVNGDNVYFSDISVMTELDAKAGRLDHIEAERYEYSAPELWVRVNQTNSAPPTPATAIRSKSFLKSFSMISNSSSPTSYHHQHNNDDATLENSEKTGSSESLTRVPLSPKFNTVQMSEWLNHASKPFKASTFSLACIFMDLLTFNAKKKLNAFQTHRTPKKSSSRGNGKPDTSFHANLGQIASWIEILDKEASERNGEDRAIKRILKVCGGMFYREPDLRPTARDVADTFWGILREEGGMPHCGTAGKLPTSKEEWEDAAVLGRGDAEWDWPWDQKHSSRNRPLTAISGQEYS
ncbi:hypothetical protein AA313_de0200210 [Arthrobotrys entomopaga]|nr:hypothetical protein AA313_de0200210 [Arthrobotrys entomopaga]